MKDKILQILSESEEPMSHSEIYKKLNKEYYRSSVFQALQRLMKEGKIERFYDEERQCNVYSLV